MEKDLMSMWTYPGPGVILTLINAVEQHKRINTVDNHIK